MKYILRKRENSLLYLIEYLLDKTKDFIYERKLNNVFMVLI